MKMKYPDLDSYRYYIYESIEQIKEQFSDIISEIKEKDSEFNEGVRHGFYCALETLRNQAEIFQIPLKEIGLEDEIPM